MIEEEGELVMEEEKEAERKGKSRGKKKEKTKGRRKSQPDCEMPDSTCPEAVHGVDQDEDGYEHTEKGGKDKDKDKEKDMDHDKDKDKNKDKDQDKDKDKNKEKDKERGKKDKGKGRRRSKDSKELEKHQGGGKVAGDGPISKSDSSNNTPKTPEENRGEKAVVWNAEESASPKRNEGRKVGPSLSMGAVVTKSLSSGPRTPREGDDKKVIASGGSVWYRSTQSPRQRSVGAPPAVNTTGARAPSEGDTAPGGLGLSRGERRPLVGGQSVGAVTRKRGMPKGDSEKKTKIVQAQSFAAGQQDKAGTVGGISPPSKSRNKNTSKLICETIEDAYTESVRNNSRPVYNIQAHLLHACAKDELNTVVYLLVQQGATATYINWHIWILTLL